MKQLLGLFLTLIFCSGSVQANEEIAVSAQAQQSVGITIYSNNLALIKDRRQVTLAKGINTLAFREVSARIKTETALMTGDGLRVLEQNFEYDLLTPQSLLQKYVGREVAIVQRHPATGEEQTVPAKVLSAGKGVVLQVGRRIETEASGRLVYPDVPATLRDRPTLTMLVESARDGSREVELSYLASGLSWQADYVAELNTSDDHLDLNGWVTLINESGTRYPKAQLQLVAGDVNITQPEMASRGRMQDPVGSKMAAASRPMAEETMFEYHLYTLQRPTDIGENQKKQVALLQADAVECRKEYLLQGQEYYYSAPSGEIGRKMKADVFIVLKNKKTSGLGLPLPGGVVRVYKKDGNGFLQFIGEDRMDHIPEDELIRLRLGKVFDITADKRQIDFKKIAGSGPFNTIAESEYEIQLNNAKKEPVTVNVREAIPGDWEILDESVPHRKETAQAASWVITIPPLDAVTLTYRVRVNY